MHFNERFSVSAISMRKLGVFNPEFGVDSHMFVDPKLLLTATGELNGAHADLLSYFASVVGLIKLIKKTSDSDISWVTAWNRMKFKETSNTSLGFSKEGTSGNGIGKTLAQRIVNRAVEILPLVDYQPDIFELAGVFTEDLGCDRLSDMIVAILKRRFIAYTDRITRTLGVQKVVPINVDGQQRLFPQFKAGDAPIILLPQEILKPLPLAMNIEEALLNADLNAAARSDVNKMFAESFKRRATPGTNQLRSFIWNNKSMFKGILSAYQRAEPVPYDFDNASPKNSDYEPIAREIVGSPSIKADGLDPWERVQACVRESLSHFRQSIEDNRLSDVLYDDAGKPRKEVISQRLIYAIATIFGKLYDVDVSREANAGPGAVDFRFTVGNKSRLLVEAKLSTHKRLKDGYYEQLPAYGKAERIAALILLVIRVSDDDSHLEALKQSIVLKSLPIRLVIIDAVSKPSASKRKSTN